MSQEKENTFINCVKSTKANCVKICVEYHVILSHFDDHVRALETVFTPNVERNLTLTEVTVKISELLDSLSSTKIRGRYKSYRSRSCWWIWKCKCCPNWLEKLAVYGRSFPRNVRFLRKSVVWEVYVSYWWLIDFTCRASQFLCWSCCHAHVCAAQKQWCPAVAIFFVPRDARDER